MKLVLASTSPRRIELLTQAGLFVEVFAPSADETALNREKPKAMVARLAREKAASMLETTKKRFGKAVIIAADTIVVAPDRKTVLGKPRDKTEALKMLRALCGHTHTVHTGYCLLRTDGKTLCRVCTSLVSMRRMSTQEIRTYIATGEPMDKAGAYAAQGLGMTLISGIKGSYTNVVGLPVSQVLEDLEKVFGVPLFRDLKKRRK